MENSAKMFERACDDMCNSKFIFFDKKISELLKSIAVSNEIYNLIAECMTNFNFGKELQTATAIEGRFASPNNNEKFVALSFCLLNALDDKKIDINALLSRNFFLDGTNAYTNFCNAVVKRFKETILEKLEPKKEEDKAEENKVEKIVEDENVIPNEATSRLQFLASTIGQNLGKKAEERIILAGFRDAIDERNGKCAYAFFVALKRILKKDKKTLQEIEQVFKSI